MLRSRLAHVKDAAFPPPRAPRVLPIESSRAVARSSEKLLRIFGLEGEYGGCWLPEARVRESDTETVWPTAAAVSQEPPA